MWNQFSYDDFSVIVQTTKPHGLPTRKFDVRMIRLIYTTSSKNVRKKDFYKDVLVNSRKFATCKEPKKFAKKNTFILRFISTEKFNQKFYYRGLKLTSVNSNWLK